MVSFKSQPFAFPYGKSHREQVDAAVNIAAPEREGEIWVLETSDVAVLARLPREALSRMSGEAQRESCLRLGNAIGRLEVTMRCFLLGPETTWIPDRRSPDLIADLEIRPDIAPTKNDWAMLQSLASKPTGHDMEVAIAQQIVGSAAKDGFKLEMDGVRGRILVPNDHLIDWVRAGRTQARVRMVAGIAGIAFEPEVEMVRSTREEVIAAIVSLGVGGKNPTPMYSWS